MSWIRFKNKQNMKGNNERPQAELQRGTNKTQESVQMSSLKYTELLSQVSNKT
jgi:hypothetical protein